MPIFRIETNIARGKVPADFLHKTTALIAKILDKPAERCMVAIIPEVAMTRGGTNEPCAFATLICLGKLGPQENRQHSAAISEHMENHLGVSKERLIIHFIDEKPYNIGNRGTTLEALT